jgi:hypothetical protein
MAATKPIELPRLQPAAQSMRDRRVPFLRNNNYAEIDLFERAFIFGPTEAAIL